MYSHHGFDDCDWSPPLDMQDRQGLSFASESLSHMAEILRAYINLFGLSKV